MDHASMPIDKHNLLQPNLIRKLDNVMLHIDMITAWQAVRSALPSQCGRYKAAPISPHCPDHCKIEARYQDVDSLNHWKVKVEYWPACASLCQILWPDLVVALRNLTAKRVSFTNDKLISITWKQTLSCNLPLASIVTESVTLSKFLY